MARNIEIGGIALQQKLDPILWQGETWAVTEYGIERLDGSRWLPAERITDGYRGAGRSLPEDIAEKGARGRGSRGLSPADRIKVE